MSQRFIKLTLASGPCSPIFVNADHIDAIILQEDGTTRLDLSNGVYFVKDSAESIMSAHLGSYEVPA